MEIWCPNIKVWYLDKYNVHGSYILLALYDQQTFQDIQNRKYDIFDMFWHET